VIVDAHQHVGDCRVFDASVSEAEVLRALDTYELDVALVMPFPGATDGAADHDRIAELDRVSGGRVRGIVNITPHQDHDAYAAEAERCVRELRFVALKLHTVGHAVDPTTRDGRMVFETAARLGVPVMVHTGGIGTPFARPSHCLPLAREFPDTAIVLAHAGMGVASREAGIVAGECPNVYLETAWCPVLDTQWLVDTVGADRLMLGSDAIENLALELAKYRGLRLAEGDLARCLGGTATEVFSLGSSADRPRPAA
jgi:predicted TIM-barrel fold metal-dependent hydrolase